MPKAPQVSVDEQLEKLPAEVRPMMTAARRVVMAAAPSAVEIPYNSTRPSNPSTMWKLARYTVNGENVVGIGTFTKHSALYFYRGRELDDGSGLLQGGGKDMRFITLRGPADADRPAVKQLVRRAFKLTAG
jgi:hypothetical protein